MVKTICWIQHTKKKIETEKNVDKDENALYKLIKNEQWKTLVIKSMQQNRLFKSQNISYTK